MNIRPATPADHDAIWAILEPTTRAGDTFALPRDMSREDAMAYWLSPGHSVFVAEGEGVVLGSYYIRANQKGGGSHVANQFFMSRSVEDDHGQVFDVAAQAARDVLQVVFDWCVNVHNAA